MSDYQLPDGWVMAKLGTIAKVRLGKMLSPKAYEKGLLQLPYLRNLNVRWFQIDLNDVKQMGFRRGETDRYSVKPGDLLVCEGGEPGRCSVVPDHVEGFMFQKALHRVRPIRGGVSTRLLQYAFRHFTDSGTIIPRASETTIKHLTLEKMKNLLLPLPPAGEQHRIVEKIEELFSMLDAGEAALERTTANLQRYRTAVLKAAVEGKLTSQWRAEHPEVEPASELLERILIQRREAWEQEQLEKYAEKGKEPPKNWKSRYKEPDAPDVYDLPELPEGWAWATVEQLADHRPNSITDGPFGSNLKTSHYTDAGPRVVRLQNVGDGIFRDEEAHISEDHFETLRKHEVFPQDLVVATLGERPPRACVVPEWLGAAIVKADVVRFRPHEKLASTGYLNAALNAEPTKQRGAEIVHGVGRPRLNLSDLRQLPLALPPLAEQHEILAEVERRLSVIDEIEKEVSAGLKRADRLRQAILKKAFEGRLVPQDAHDERAGDVLGRIEAQS